METNIKRIAMTLMILSMLAVIVLPVVSSMDNITDENRSSNDFDENTLNNTSQKEDQNESFDPINQRRDNFPARDVVSNRNPKIPSERADNVNDIPAKMMDRGETKRDNITENAMKKRTEVQEKIQTLRETPPGPERREIALQFKSEYTQSRDNFRNINEQIRNNSIPPNSDIAINATKNYMLSTVDYMIVQLDNIKQNAQSLGNQNDKVEQMEYYIEQLETERANLENIDDSKDLADTAQNILTIWREAYSQSESISFDTMTKRIEDYLTQTESYSIRIENEITNLSDAGRDTGHIEELYMKYRQLIEEAENNYESALSIAENRSDEQSLKEAMSYLQISREYIDEANTVLRDLFTIIENERNGQVKLNSSEKLSSNGNGTVVLSGNLSIDVSTSNSKLIIKDLAQDSHIRVDGDYWLVNGNIEGSDDQRALVYQDLNGSAFIEGSQLTVVIVGDDISLNVAGDGKVVFSGTGKYTIESDTGSSQRYQWIAGFGDQEYEVIDGTDAIKNAEL